MSNRSDLEYLERRRDECRVKAHTATDPGIARIHREFAERYARVIEGIGVESDARPSAQHIVG
jgi:hypothetical protein